MAINYRIYSNGGGGGAVDYSTPVLTTAAPGATLGPLGPSTDTTFAVRAFDTTSGLEEANTTAWVRVVVDANGDEVTPPTYPPHAVTVVATRAGGCRVSWAYVPADGYGIPTGFHVYLGPTPGAPPAQPTVVPYCTGRVGYSVLLPGPYAAATYTATVVGYNASGEGGGASQSAPLPGPPTATYDVDGLEIQVL